MKTTLQQLREARACYEGYNRVVRFLQGREFTEKDERREHYLRDAELEGLSVGLGLILESNGIQDALWALRAVPQTDQTLKAECLFSLWCAKQVKEKLFYHEHKTLLQVAEAHSRGRVSDEKLRVVREDAYEAPMDSAASTVLNASNVLLLSKETPSLVEMLTFVTAITAAGALGNDRSRIEKMFKAVFCGDGDVPDVSQL